MTELSAWIHPYVEGLSPTWAETFSASKTDIHSTFENEHYLPCVACISNLNFANKNTCILGSASFIEPDEIFVLTINFRMQTSWQSIGNHVTAFLFYDLWLTAKGYSLFKYTLNPGLFGHSPMLIRPDIFVPFYQSVPMVFGYCGIVSKHAIPSSVDHTVP